MESLGVHQEKYKRIVEGGSPSADNSSPLTILAPRIKESSASYLSREPRGTSGEFPSLTTGDRSRNDDYFPQGDEYEDEIGTDYGQLQKPSGSKGFRDSDYDSFASSTIS
ncbi:hypothetical protein KM043_004723 [Ampulex compressa]|nr:hypothetical protein KM043_004723 [Ampulex compressa]